MLLRKVEQVLDSRYHSRDDKVTSTIAHITNHLDRGDQYFYDDPTVVHYRPIFLAPADYIKAFAAIMPAVRAHADEKWTITYGRKLLEYAERFQYPERAALTEAWLLDVQKLHQTLRETPEKGVIALSTIGESVEMVKSDNRAVRAMSAGLLEAGLKAHAVSYGAVCVLDKAFDAMEKAEIAINHNAENIRQAEEVLKLYRASNKLEEQAHIPALERRIREGKLKAVDLCGFNWDQPDRPDVKRGGFYGKAAALFNAAVAELEATDQPDLLLEGLKRTHSRLSEEGYNTKTFNKRKDLITSLEAAQPNAGAAIDRLTRRQPPTSDKDGPKQGG